MASAKACVVTIKANVLEIEIAKLDLKDGCLMQENDKKLESLRVEGEKTKDAIRSLTMPEFTAAGRTFFEFNSPKPDADGGVNERQGSNLLI